MKKVSGVQVLFHDRKSMNAAPWKKTIMSEIYSCQTGEAESLKHDIEEEEQQSVHAGFSRVRGVAIASQMSSHSTTSHAECGEAE